MYIKEEKCKTCECENREECTLKKNNVKYELENYIFNFVSSGDEVKNRRNKVRATSDPLGPKLNIRTLGIWLEKNSSPVETN